MIVGLVLVTSAAAAQEAGGRGGAGQGVLPPGGPNQPGGRQGGAGRGQFQRPARDREVNQPKGTSSITGRVLSLEGLPLRRAQVQMTGADNQVRRATTTDNQGIYSFAELPAGRYTVRASRGGYVSFAHGQKALNEVVPPVTVGNGETIGGVDVVLPRGSVIAGRVTDEFGDPILQAQVQALRYQFLPDGQRRLVPAGAAITDDLGQFRVFGLNPGDYVVSAISRQPGPRGPFAGNQPESEEGYAPTYYPGTHSPAEAQPIPLALGQEMTVALQLSPARLTRIIGSVINSQGQPPPNGTPVMLRPVGSVGGNVSGAATGDGGVFTMPNVPPGDYLLEVRPNLRPRLAAQQNEEPEFGSMPVSASGGELSGVRLVTSKGATLSGRIVFEGTAPKAGTQIRVVAQPSDPERQMLLANRNQENGVVGADGSFRVTGLAGPVFLRVNGLQGYMTKSVVVDGVDVTDVPFDALRGGSTTSVRIVLTDRLTEVTGSIADGRGTPPPDSLVLIVPETLPDGVSPTRFVRVVRAEPDGKFSTKGLPVGRYVAVALDSFDQSRQFDPDVHAHVRQVGRGFSLREGSPATVNLSLVDVF